MRFNTIFWSLGSGFFGPPCTAPQLPHMLPRGAVVTDRAGEQPRSQPKRAVTDFGL